MADEQLQPNLYDPRQVQLDHLGQMDVEKIQLDFNDPHVARFLAQELKVRIYDLRKAQSDLELVRTAAEVARRHAEDLRVDNGILSERDRLSWIEFPAGILCGIAGNLLVADRTDFMGWALLVFGLFIFLVIRLPQLRNSRRGAQ